jgi:hypothetical protein
LPSETGASGAHAERLLLRADQVHRWRGRVRGQTLLRTFQGTLLLTSRRLVFLSSGGNGGVWWRMALAGVSGIPGPVGQAVMVGDAATSALRWIAQRFGNVEDDGVTITGSQLLKDGSLSVPLAQLDDFGFVARRLRRYLWITYTASDGTRHEYAFSGQAALPGGQAWETLIREAREEQPS